ncbi:hypothetical protein [Brevundimonas naejangsanensis]|uniref:hypothetical protein n=1 Tax=Brevundimonas naejangsanensis TaxID=588932 RepID=UPI001968E581|nr:hypothetical protein [Brevundimonas naejangsanensis]
MKTLMLSFGTGENFDLGGHRDDGRSRRLAALRAAFELGPAWHGGRDALFLRTDKTVEEVVQYVLRLMDDRDLRLVVEIADGADVRFGGTRFDEDGFDKIFSMATEVDHPKVWAEVHAAHAAALANGGSDEGAPGPARNTAPTSMEPTSVILTATK